MHVSSTYRPQNQLLPQGNLAAAASYTFSAKEKDSETNLSYFGARYYTSDLSVWLSVDPMSAKYPSLSPYVYCANNPVKLVDPNGEEYGIPPWLLIKGIARVVEATSQNADVKTIAYSINNPIRAIYIKLNLNMVATNFQINIGRAINCPQNEEGSPQNAIRHTLWQALIMRDFGESHASRVANAHENNNNINTSSRQFSSNEDADKVADLLNNKIGRDIGKKYSSYSNKNMAKAVMKEYFNFGLWTVHKSNSNYTLIKTKISKEQYDAAIKEIDTKGENGLNQ